MTESAEPSGSAPPEFVRHHLLSLFVFFNLSSQDASIILQSFEKIDVAYTETIDVAAFGQKYVGTNHSDCLLKLWELFKPALHPPVAVDGDDTLSRPGSRANGRKTGLGEPLRSSNHSRPNTQANTMGKQQQNTRPGTRPDSRPATQGNRNQNNCPAVEMVPYFDWICFLLFVIPATCLEIKELTRIVFWLVFFRPKQAVTLEVSSKFFVSDLCILSMISSEAIRALYDV